MFPFVKFKLGTSQIKMATCVRLQRKYLFVLSSLTICLSVQMRGTTNIVANESYSKLQPRATRPFKMLKVHDKMLSKADSGIPETVSNNLAIHASMTYFIDTFSL